MYFKKELSTFGEHCFKHNAIAFSSTAVLMASQAIGEKLKRKLEVMGEVVDLEVRTSYKQNERESQSYN